jgi:DNA primase
MGEIDDDDLGDKTTRDLRIAGIATVDDAIEREQLSNALAKALKVSRATVANEVNKARERIIQQGEEKPPVPIAELRTSARKIIKCEDVLELLLQASNPGIAGERSLRQLIYLVGTSRLFPRPMNLSIKGPSSVGKSKTRDSMLDFFPPEDVIAFTALSEKALLFLPDQLHHKILSMGEALKGEDESFQAAMVRQLMSEGVLRYRVPVKQPGGNIETVEKVVEGPVTLMVTTTSTKLYHENETRMLSAEADDSARQTRRVLHKIALTEGMLRSSKPLNLEQWHAFQRWLAAGETRVLVPFAEVLQQLIENYYSLRLRRDFTQLLDAIKAHALIHREHRSLSTKGSIVATINEDYAKVQPLMADIMATAAEMKVRGAVLDVVDVVQAMVEANPEIERMTEPGVTVRQINAKLKLDRSSTYRRLTQAEEMGLLKNMEPRKGQAARYLPTKVQPKAEELLPSVEALERAYKASLKQKQKSRLSQSRKRLKQRSK